MLNGAFGQYLNGILELLSKFETKDDIWCSGLKLFEMMFLKFELLSSQTTLNFLKERLWFVCFICIH